ncbi:MAG: DUF1080 domain-containing protein [Chthoniobacter sp.]|uniref:3-keto-disaccharide hydrolase n=1 Tax=Chthoniobacter sp. TaxID=2510640 RepID=UPI0032A57CC3
MNRSPFKLLCLLVVTLLSALSHGRAESPFIGRWALTLPSGSAGWLGVEEKDGKLQGSILWSGGSVLPVDGVKIDSDTLTITRVAKGVTETITGKVTGDDLALTTVKSKGDGKEFAKADFSGKRIPPVPPTPDLSKVKFGDAITLFNGKDLSGWVLVNPKADNGWSVVDGVLQNRVEPGKHLGNLRTEREFEDFNLKLEVRTLAGSNSGIYLRGIYEIQVAESYGKPLDPHNMGALYSRITPSVAAEKPVGEWQTFDITLVDRHVTVILNGQKIIDNQPVLGCTGGALTSDESKPGPIMLQGDHTSIDYRNIVLRPVVK